MRQAAQSRVAAIMKPTAVCETPNGKGTSDLLQRVLDQLPLCVFWKNLDGVYLGCNRSFAQDAGFVRTEDVIGLTDASFGWSSDAADPQQLSGGETGMPRCRLKTTRLDRDGEVEIFETTCTALLDHEGATVGILGFYDSQGHPQGRFGESDQAFRELVETVNDILFSLDPEGRITYISPVIQQVTEFHPSEVVGMNFMEFIHLEDVKDLEQSFRQTLDGKVSPTEFRLITKSGRIRWVRSSSRAVRQGDGIAGVRGVIVDITDQRALEQQLRQAQKMEAIGQLAAGVAHDFNNLLTTILGYSDLLSRRFPDDDQRLAGLEEIHRAAQRAASLTQQLLAFGRKQLLEMKVLDLTTIVQDTESMLRRLIGENIVFRTKLSPSLGRIRCDHSQLEQVIINLVVNARDAMPQGGTLTIETANVDFEQDQRFHQVTLPAGRYVELTVKDNGSGMPAEVVSQIFEPFFTTKELGKGTGLGLATAYGIVKQSDGYIFVESQPGAGTTFRIYFPRVPSESGQSEAQAETVSRARAAETLMVVEDDSGVRRLMCQILRNIGYAVIEAQHPGEALLMCEHRHEQIDLLITDVVMPHMSGPELASRLTASRPDMKVLYVSGYADDTVALRGVRDSAFLQKPYRPEVFARKVRELLESEDRSVQSE